MQRKVFFMFCMLLLGFVFFSKGGTAFATRQSPVQELLTKHQVIISFITMGKNMIDCSYDRKRNISINWSDR